MNESRLQRDISAAQQKFDYLECYRNTSGTPYVLVALQAPRQLYTLEITFCNYPYAAPYVVVRKPMLIWSPHQYEGSRICYVHPNRWNSGLHDVEFVIARAAKWLHKYEVFRVTERWPGAGHEHR